ncbi:MAG TPA: hypothetical protein VGC76_08415 [Pyrinomonadaceae bacterium]|jgi:hypothetical protein
MPDNTAKMYSYTVNCDGDSAIFDYVEQNGSPLISMFGIIDEEGQWAEAPFGITIVNFAKHGDGGVLITLAATPFSDDPSMGGEDFALTLVFNSQIDWTQPLPLDKFSTDGSVYTVNNWNIVEGGTIQHFQVTSLSLDVNDERVKTGY